MKLKHKIIFNTYNNHYFIINNYKIGNIWIIRQIMKIF